MKFDTPTMVKISFFALLFIIAAGYGYFTWLTALTWQQWSALLVGSWILLYFLTYMQRRRPPPVPIDFWKAFELWLTLPSGHHVSIEKDSTDWDELERELNNGNLVIKGKFPLKDGKIVKGKEKMLILDPTMSTVDEDRTNEIYWGRMLDRKEFSRIRKGPVVLDPIEEEALRRVKQAEISEEVKERVEGIK
jgi:hypothetical protein